jgi:hypothetical protein
MFMRSDLPFPDRMQLAAIVVLVASAITLWAAISDARAKATVAPDTPVIGLVPESKPFHQPWHQSPASKPGASFTRDELRRAIGSFVLLEAYRSRSGLLFAR